MPLAIYEQLWELHAGFDQVRRALGNLSQHKTFHAPEVERLYA